MSFGKKIQLGKMSNICLHSLHLSSQADGFCKVAPLVALHAGDPKLSEMVEKMVRVTQDNELAVSCSLGSRIIAITHWETVELQ